MTNLSFLKVRYDNSENRSNNPDMVTDITDCDDDDCPRLHTNSGPTVFDKKANLNVFPLKVHFKKKLMATIISFSDICDIDGIRFIFGSHIGIYFNVILQVGIHNGSNK